MPGVLVDNGFYGRWDVPSLSAFPGSTEVYDAVKSGQVAKLQFHHRVNLLNALINSLMDSDVLEPRFGMEEFEGRVCQAKGVMRFLTIGTHR